MGIQLTDIITATSDYLHDQVEVRIGRVTANLEPGETGTWTVRWTNAAAPVGVRLTDLLLHVLVEPGSVALLKPPGSPQFQPRATANINDPILPRNGLYDEFFLFLPGPGIPAQPYDSVLDVGETGELELGFEAVAAGTATLKAHVHAKVDFDNLFGTANGVNGTRDVVIRN